MFRAGRFLGLTGFSLWAIMGAGHVRAQEMSTTRPLLKGRVDPKEFGVQDYTRTVIPATSFHVVDLVSAYEVLTYLTPDLGRSCGCTGGLEYWANLDLPAGAVIDYIGVNTTTDTDAIIGFALYQRDASSNKTLLYGFSVPAHGWATDYAGPLGIAVTDHIDKELMLNVEQAPSAFAEYFGWVEVWWRRTVSPAPGTATFNDVPTTHPFFQFIEALAASGTTAGCQASPPLYCPDAPLTRGQMAVFLSKALGLHWPN